jgi:hypothetical protein
VVGQDWDRPWGTSGEYAVTPWSHAVFPGLLDSGLSSQEKMPTVRAFTRNCALMWWRADQVIGTRID